LLFLPWFYVVLLIFLLVTSLVILFYQQIENYYHWFENQFLSTFEQKEQSQPDQNLAPWDAHLTRVEIHPNSDLIVKQLREAKLRDQYGINIVVIQRGNTTIVAPSPDEVILPFDELLLLGTDEQLEAIRPLLETAKLSEDPSKRISNYELKQVRLWESSPFVGKTIRNAGIRESFGAIAVGVERDQSRIINPPPDLELKKGDILWIAGQRNQLEKLRAYSGG
jgi:CPA2 family monovalent cation:H+ antiporter-2